MAFLSSSSSISQTFPNTKLSSQRFDTLPKNHYEVIGSFLTKDELSKVFRVSSRIKNGFDTEKVWMLLAKRDFRNLEKPTVISWKNHYKYCRTGLMEKMQNSYTSGYESVNKYFPHFVNVTASLAASVAFINLMHRIASDSQTNIEGACKALAGVVGIYGIGYPWAVLTQFPIDVIVDFFFGTHLTAKITALAAGAIFFATKASAQRNISIGASAVCGDMFGPLHLTGEKIISWADYFRNMRFNGGLISSLAFYGLTAARVLTNPDNESHSRILGICTIASVINTAFIYSVIGFSIGSLGSILGLIGAGTALGYLATTSFSDVTYNLVSSINRRVSALASRVINFDHAKDLAGRAIGEVCRWIRYFKG